MAQASERAGSTRRAKQGANWVWLDAQGISQQKPDGTWESINEYVVPGKERPALILQEIPNKYRQEADWLVWYACTSEKDLVGAREVTSITKPPGQKRAFLKPISDEIRRIPKTEEWCKTRIQKLDQTIFGSLLEEVQKFHPMR